ncbi:MAG TPA: methyltransferase [Nocardioidaceae bacterium]|nr:methyltransferase [Nocardioidaceae bacterium]
MNATSDMLRLIVGFRVSQAVHVAAELRLADHLAAGPLNVSTLAERVGADPDALRRLLRALSATGVFVEQPDDVFATNELGATLESQHPARLRAISSNTSSTYFWDAWGRLEHSVRTGENAFYSLHGMNVWEYRSQHPEAAERFDAAMVAMTLAVARGLAESYDFAAVRTLVDVGGGHGGLLAAVLDAHPAIQGVLYDLPHVVATAPAELAARGLGDRVRLEAGSFFEQVPADGDCYLLKSVLHDWEDDDCVRILSACAAAMRSDAVLLVVERLLDGPNEGADTKFSDLNMMVLPGGRERSADEFGALAAAAGMSVTRIVPTSTAFHALELVVT